MNSASIIDTGASIILQHLVMNKIVFLTHYVNKQDVSWIHVFVFILSHEMKISKTKNCTIFSETILRNYLVGSNKGRQKKLLK